MGGTEQWQQANDFRRCFGQVCQPETRGGQDDGKESPSSAVGIRGLVITGFVYRASILVEVQFRRQVDLWKV